MFSDKQLHDEVESAIRRVVTVKFANENIRRVQVSLGDQGEHKTLTWEAVVGRMKISDRLLLDSQRSQAQMQIRLSVAYHLAKVTRPDYLKLLQAEAAHIQHPDKTLLMGLLIIWLRGLTNADTWKQRLRQAKRAKHKTRKR